MVVLNKHKVAGQASQKVSQPGSEPPTTKVILAQKPIKDLCLDTILSNENIVIVCNMNESLRAEPAGRPQNAYIYTGKPWFLFIWPNAH